MDEIWAYNAFPNPEKIPDPFTVYIDRSADPVTVQVDEMPEPASIGGEDWRRLMGLCFDRADRFSLHRRGYPGARPGALERALRPFLAGTYRSYACLHIHDEQFWEKCFLYRAEPETREIILSRVTHLFDREPEAGSQELPKKYRAYEQERKAAEIRSDAFWDQAGDEITMEEAEAFDKENFRESWRLWKEVFDPADFQSSMEDLCFFRGREAFFETVTHEYECFVRVRDPEFARELRAMGAWLDRTEDFRGRLFRLDEAKELAEYK